MQARNVWSRCLWIFAHQWWFSMHDHLATYLLTTLHHSLCLQLVADHLPKEFDALVIGVPCITWCMHNGWVRLNAPTFCPSTPGYSGYIFFFWFAAIVDLCCFFSNVWSPSYFIQHTSGFFLYHLYSLRHYLKIKLTPWKRYLSRLIPAPSLFPLLSST